MAKHRKTLEQKKIADLRHKFYSFEPKDISFKKNPSSSFWGVPLSGATPESDSGQARMTVLKHDILKTGILTLSIIGIQLILFVLLKKHILVLPIVNY